MRIMDKIKIPATQTSKIFIISQISLRIFAIAATGAAAYVVLTSKQTAVAYGFQVDARYSYTPAFRFLPYVNLTACACSVVSVFLIFFFVNKGVNPKNYFYVFLHDLTITLLLLGGCSAATAIGYVGKYGDERAGWLPICVHFAKFCDKLFISGILTYLSLVFYLFLTVISAHLSSHQIQA
ncbi:CASP-like protein 1F1 [Primulina tabacum]|uniref:CASP-like protein 1F1 n=1 Tax=Primulina tabacum TaxID=48773 RepID=UPI003F59B0A7